MEIKHVEKLNIVLKKVRLEKGYTQKVFSQMLGIHKAPYSLLERGRRHPSFPTIKKIVDTINGLNIKDIQLKYIDYLNKT